MSEEKLYKRLGIEKEKHFVTNFDNFCDKYRQKAISAGYSGELKFVRERGKVIIYTSLA